MDDFVTVMSDQEEATSRGEPLQATKHVADRLYTHFSKGPATRLAPRFDLSSLISLPTEARPTINGRRSYMNGDRRTAFEQSQHRSIEPVKSVHIELDIQCHRPNAEVYRLDFTYVLLRLARHWRSAKGLQHPSETFEAQLIPSIVLRG